MSHVNENLSVSLLHGRDVTRTYPFSISRERARERKEREGGMSHVKETLAVSLCRTQVSFVGLFCIRDLQKKLLPYLSRTAVT